MAARNLLKRDYVQLAHVYDPKKHSPAGWYASEKLDGQRAWWDGGVSRGKPAAEIPYANTVKDARYIFPPTATGLWSRYGNVIYAPDWFLDMLPGYCLDGELWSGRGNFQTNQATIKDLIPGPGWRNVRYMIFDVPLPSILFQDGDITVQNYKVYLRGCYPWWQENYSGLTVAMTSFEGVHNYLCSHLKMSTNLKVHTQWRLPFSTSGAVEEMNRLLSEVLAKGGEGLVLRKPASLWEPKRSWNSLKVKDYKDAEATVIGYTTGRETDKGSKLLGMMGALITNFNGKRLELSGFTEAERILDVIGPNGGLIQDNAVRWATENPEKEVPDWITNPMFPRGSQVSFRYRELTDDSIPKEARYWRKA